MNIDARLATHQHCRCYYRQRAIVRILFWSIIVIMSVYAFHKFCGTDAAVAICSTIGDCQPTR